MEKTLISHLGSQRAIRSVFGVLCLGISLSASAAPLVPLQPGATWQYARTGAEPAELLVRIAGKEQSGELELLKRETLAGDAVSKTELVRLDQRGLVCYGRTGRDGKMAMLNPPQVLVPAKLQVGATWEFDDEFLGAESRQKFTVVKEEEVVTPAGKFRAFRMRAEQPWPISGSIERWFAPGTGLVKEVITTRGPTGRLMSRVASSLQKFEMAPPPASEASPAAIPTPVELPSARITAQVMKERDGQPQTEFRSDVPNIFVEWRGENLPQNSYVRVAWIAEDVGDLVEKDFIVDETETEITSADFGARFTLSRPKDGWAPGKYRVEIYLDDELVETVKVSIAD